MITSNVKETVKIAFIYAIGFVLLAVVMRIYDSKNTPILFKIITIGAYLLGLIFFFTRDHLVKFAGFSFMLLCYNHILADESIEVIWKIFSAGIILLQIGTLGEEKLLINRKHENT